MKTDVIDKSQISSWRAWILAFRPRTLTAAVIPVMVSSILAHGSWMVALFAFLVAISMQIGTNLINDAADYKRGADTEARLGFLRVTQAKLLSFNQVFAAGIAAFACGALFGVPLILQGGWEVGVVIILSIICGYIYTSGPFPLAYHGMGELFVFIFFGLVSTSTIYFINTQTVSLACLLAGIQIGLLAVVIIAINNLRDHQQDRQANKKTLAVRFGVTFGRIKISLCALLPFVLNLFWISSTSLMAALLPLLTLPIAIKLVWQIWKIEPSREYNQLFIQAAALHFVFGTLLSIGFLL